MFKTREHLILEIESKILPQYMSIARSLAEGSIELLGGFSSIPPLNKPGWIIRTKSKFKKYYYIALVVDSFETRLYIIHDVPWKYWDGDSSKNKIYQGDRPELYRRLKNAGKKERPNQNT